MNPRLLAALGVLVLALGAGGAAWWLRASPESPAPLDLTAEDLPVPPVPPRIAETDQYDKCMTMLEADPEGAEAIAAAWQQNGGGDAALHCQALAMIAIGDPETGAEMLEELAKTETVKGAMRAVVLGQATQARLMAEQAEPALKDATEALTLSPDDADLLIDRATAAEALDRLPQAMDDLNRVVDLDPSRNDALVLRATVWRRMDMLTEARSDIDKALAIDADDPDALLERGVLRQRAGDLAGARADWEKVRDLDPTSETAEQAAQNLTLLDAGPERK